MARAPAPVCELTGEAPCWCDACLVRVWCERFIDAAARERVDPTLTQQILAAVKGALARGMDGEDFGGFLGAIETADTVFDDMEAASIASFTGPREEDA